MSNLPELSKSEHDVLNVLWARDQMSVREVHDLLATDGSRAYTTTKTVMDRMLQKQLLQRENFHGVFVYRAAISRPRGLARLVHNFARRVLEVDNVSAVSLFSGSKKISKAELAELEALLQKLDDEESASQ
ncbi:BlaI/MecI/CopY family transcriptional regulator [Gilvimarinus sp. SDUM040013]|uniref:BlaI/MecI/CopY family transcriptional regulator n=1 Tax=Gilvimarinus gilvus TaxID=3058038 RepID=A0ABU4RYU6_9GAMM|nr:BlaI/MecI/CopY family transcriptional regulator [Gilvimarinus sp. SDUM040013]MDO3386687.1 BlaI/MecI/CopY family transcriptional regulator [Gilvimarinus sp. SDUM040013]MDX6849426.1 BlaI/MecI/CopY family transcriptional regulator [Gilvimarinus sp. SDUM040013]